MDNEASGTEAQSQASLAEELAAIPYEPLLPIEKRLIVSSLILGVTLLVVLSWITATFFPVEPPAPAAKDQTDGPRPSEGGGTLPVGLSVGRERAGDARRHAAKADDQLVAHVKPLEIVVPGLRDREPVASEDGRGFEDGGGIDPGRDHGVLAKHDRLLLAVSHQHQAKAGLVDRPRSEVDRLEEAIGAGGHKAKPNRETQ